MCVFVSGSNTCKSAVVVTVLDVAIVVVVIVGIALSSVVVDN